MPFSPSCLPSRSALPILRIASLIGVIALGNPTAWAQQDPDPRSPSAQETVVAPATDGAPDEDQGNETGSSPGSEVGSTQSTLDDDPQLEALLDRRWGQIQGLMAGITFAHAIQPIAAAVGDIEWKDKYLVASAGGVLYGLCFAGLMYEQQWALWIAIIGPVTGIVSVTTGWILSETEVIDLEVRPDAFQLGGGVLQVLAWLIAYQLLSEDPQFDDPSDDQTDDPSDDHPNDVSLRPLLAAPAVAAEPNDDAERGPRRLPRAPTPFVGVQLSF